MTSLDKFIKTSYEKLLTCTDSLRWNDDGAFWVMTEVTVLIDDESKIHFFNGDTFGTNKILMFFDMRIYHRHDLCFETNDSVSLSVLITDCI
jgi:CRISPR/Cas system CMR-associated protein Cmr3 (group 5 of RAMP superfamily)